VDDRGKSIGPFSGTVELSGAKNPPLTNQSPAVIRLLIRKSATAMPGQIPS
jgi:hypothetical protein